MSNEISASPPLQVRVARTAVAPLTAHDTMDALFAVDGDSVITVQDFLNDVHALAATLPRRRYVLNACRDRYLFTVALGAALVSEQVTLLPSSQTPSTLQSLAAGHAGLYALADVSAALALETVHVARAAPGMPWRHHEIPTLPVDQIALIVFTSGSTGQPVPTAKTWGSLVESAGGEARALGITRDMALAVLGTVPAQHSYGLESTVLLPLHAGQILSAAHPFYPMDVCVALGALPRPRMLVSTPVHLRALCALEQDLPIADIVLSATAPLSLELAELARSRFGGKVMEIYGCSEAGQIAFRDPLASSRWTLMQGLSMRQDTHGTWVAGAHVPAPTLLCDVIEMTGADHFELHGRQSDLINIAGKRTSLAYLNHQLNGIEGVRDGAFFMPETPAEHSGRVTRLMAFVVAPGLSESALRGVLRQRIDAAFMPRPLVILEHLPRSSTGKLTREALLLLARAHVTAPSAP